MKTGEKGVALVELVIAISIWGLVGVAVSGGIFQILRNAELNTNHMSAVLQVQNADQRISRDANKAQIIATDNLTLPDFLVLSWIDGNTGDEYRITYVLEDMPYTGLTQLRRDQSINGSDNTTLLVARYIDPSPARTNCQFSDGILTLTITASVGGGASMESETRTYKVVTRPG